VRFIGRQLQAHAYEITGWIAGIPLRCVFARLQWRAWAFVRDIGFWLQWRRWVPTDLRGVR
jgi:hypothetical protein